ncbi:hypothetical protein ACF3N0_00100 [Moraxella atlantae]|uniref:hypothetical protein n=1 Tax=Faucicola atlantae TaxID=34059 RepID=UPI003752D9E1
MSKSIYEMTDEELLALDPQEQVMSDDLESDSEMEAEPHQSEDNVSEEESQEQEVPEQTTEDTESTDDETQTDITEPNLTDETANDQEQEASVNTEESGIDYESFYKVITSPFKANGKEFQITDPNDVIRLAQQGINYSKKMEKLKPQQAIIKTLEDNGLLDNDKLGYLIDLYNKKPEAIAKLVKDSEIDLYEFDTEQANDYVPSEVIKPVNQITEVIDTLTQESPEFINVLDSVIDTWDNQSKQIIYENPQLLYIFNEQNKHGLFSKINNAIEYERMLGRMQGLTYLQAYNEIEQRFINQQEVEQAPQSFTAPRPNQTKPSNNNNNNSKNKAAIPSNKPSSDDSNINLLALSDEEFLKLNQRQYG